MAVGNQTLTVAPNGGTSVALREADELVTVQRLGGLLAASGFFSDAREMAQAAVKVLAGRELGLPPVAAMMGINIIKGKVALGGNLIASRIRAHGYDYRHKRFDERGCVLEFLGKPDASGKRPILGESSFTEEDAARAQINSDMYKKYPRNMYFNRAISNGAKWFCAEVFAGAPVYTPEELGADVDEDGNVVHATAEQIDTGGHPVGTREAQQVVAERKIAEMREKAEPFHATDDDPPPELGVPMPDPPKPNGKPWKTFKQMLERFAEIREALNSAGGSDADYYGELDLAGVRNANEFKDTDTAVRCYRALEAKLRYIQQGGSGVAT